MIQTNKVGQVLKFFVSEYAVTQGCGNGNLQAAVAEAAFMTGLVRNSDIVELASYAPLFVNVNNRAWNPDIIQFNNHANFPTPSYYVQELFAKYTGDKVVTHNTVGGNQNFAAVASFDSTKKLLYIPVVNFAATSTNVTIAISGATFGQGSVAHVITSPTGNPNDENTATNPNLITIKTSNFAASSKFVYSAPHYSVSILQIQTN